MRILLAGLLVLITPLPGLAWGPEGHAIVAELAQRHPSCAKFCVDETLRSLSPRQPSPAGFPI